LPKRGRRGEEEWKRAVAGWPPTPDTLHLTPRVSFSVDTLGRQSLLLPPRKTCFEALCSGVRDLGGGLVARRRSVHVRIMFFSFPSLANPVGIVSLMRSGYSGSIF
jgi:hypothetical protein